jgi:hypothetical protein
LTRNSLRRKQPENNTFFLYGASREVVIQDIDSTSQNEYITAYKDSWNYGVIMLRCFDQAQMPVASGAFNDAERLVSLHFRMSGDDFRKNRYDVKTLAFLEQHEVKDGAFAHLCKYSYDAPSDLKPESRKGFDFYRICLQDNSILDAVDRANSFVKLKPLMLYIAVHELIHVIRFSTGTIDFDAPQKEKEQEEKIVHRLTRSALQPVKQNDLEIIMDCFDDAFTINDLYN